jgi:regulatory protein
MLKKDEENKLYEEAYNHLRKSDLTSDELTNKLLKKHPKKKGVINQIIKDLKQKNLINDDRFVGHFIRKGISSFKGFERIKYELSIKGIDEQIIYENFDEELRELEKEKAYQLGSKQLRLSKNLDFKKARDKVYYKLAYAGYNKEIIDEIMYKLNLIKEI